MIHSIKWNLVNKNMAGITPSGKVNAYFFDTEFNTKGQPDVFVKLISIENTAFPWNMHKFKVIPLYL